MKRLLAIACCLCSLAAVAQTPATGRDYSDLWWNSGESGWGMNVIHQDRILFVTLFVYGPDRRPTWYVGPSVAYSSTNAQGEEIFTGDLYATMGTPFNAGAFDPATVTVAKVGTLTFVGRANGNSSVSYTVNDVVVANASVAKSVVRQTWAANVVTAARYKGYSNYTRTGCSNPSDNGVISHSADIGELTITNSAFTMSLVEPDDRVTLAGNYAQAGRMGSSVGTVHSAGGLDPRTSTPATGTYSLTEIQVTPQAFGVKFSAGFPGSCQLLGQIGGTRY